MDCVCSCKKIKPVDKPLYYTPLLGIPGPSLREMRKKFKGLSDEQLKQKAEDYYNETFNEDDIDLFCAFCIISIVVFIGALCYVSTFFH